MSTTTIDDVKDKSFDYIVCGTSAIERRIYVCI